MLRSNEVLLSFAATSTAGFVAMPTVKRKSKSLECNSFSYCVLKQLKQFYSKHTGFLTVGSDAARGNEDNLLSPAYKNKQPYLTVCYNGPLKAS